MPDESIEQTILRYIESGYRVIWKDMYSAQLVKSKRLRGGVVATLALFISFFAVLVLPLQTTLTIAALSLFVLLLLAFDYLNARDATVYLYLSEDGTVQSITR
ncbi:MAG: hypothetical protein V1899_03030 [Planctomycetota bacterium]